MVVSPYSSNGQVKSVAHYVLIDGGYLKTKHHPLIVDGLILFQQIPYWFMDGFKSELKVMDVHGLFNAAMQLFQEYNAAKHLYYMGAFKDSYMTEHQFAQFLGKCRLYQYLPVEQKKKLPQMLMTDTQIGIVAKSFYNDENFSTIENGNEISMWNVYNLLTGANKSSYIDNFLDRAYNATQLADGLNKALYGDSEYAWFIQ